MDATKIPFYQQNIDLYSGIVDKLKKQHRTLSFIRLGVIIVFILSIFWLIRLNVTLGIGIGATSIVAFLVLIKKHLKLEQAIEFNTQLLKINTSEKACCQGNYDDFEAGEAYIDVNHPYSYDIDLFGKGSLFQYLNRTTTRFGSKQLFEWLAHVPLQNHKIIQIQDAVKELSKNVTLRQHLMATGSRFQTHQNEEELIDTWINLSPFFAHKWICKLALWGIPLLSVTILMLTVTGILSVGWLAGVFLFNGALLGLKMQKFNQAYSLLNQSHGNLKKVEKLLQLIGSQKFESGWLVNLQADTRNQNLSAHEQINQLTKTIDKLDYRINFLLAIVLNGLFLWDWQYIVKAETWKMRHKMAYKQWTNAIGKLEAVCCLANFYFNNPKACFPEPAESQMPFFEAHDLGHPLIESQRRVGNTISLSGIPQFAIITGANMAGKSTFLRTISVNLVLAGCGAPVIASTMRFTPLPLFTSMRTEDSIQKNESYFFAELKRLQRITKQVESGSNQIIILDEILRGTNSDDKRSGSIGFIKKITRHNAFGFVATHDLELARLASNNPEVFKAFCFEVKLDHEQLEFDYKLKTGITQNMNATFLMQQMGIIDTIKTT